MIFRQIVLVALLVLSGCENLDLTSRFAASERPSERRIGATPPLQEPASAARRTASAPPAVRVPPRRDDGVRYTKDGRMLPPDFGKIDVIDVQDSLKALRN